MNRPAKLLVADFGPTRLGVRMALADHEVEICAEADDAAYAIAAAKLAQPDICLVGSELPGGGIAAVRGIQVAAPGAAVIVLAGRGDASELVTAIRAGAIGYVLGTTTREQLRRAIRAALAGEAVVPRSMLRALMCELRKAAGSVAGEAHAVKHDGWIAETSTVTSARLVETSPVTVQGHASGRLPNPDFPDRSALVSVEPGVAVDAGARRDLADDARRGPSAGCRDSD